MGYFTVFLINGPLLMANIFFVFCLMTRKTQQVKQPLMTVLGSMVSFAILYELSVVLMACMFEVKSEVVQYIFSTIGIFLMRMNMTTYGWLMVYYPIMIVPSQRAFFLWVRKNIKTVIYGGMLLDSLIFLSNALFEITYIIHFSKLYNGAEFAYYVITIMFLSIVNVYMFLRLFGMMISCFTIAHYLNKQMKSLAASGRSLSNPRLHSQIRVTVTGIIQGVLCFLYALWTLLYVMSFFISIYICIDGYFNFAVNNLYFFGTTVNLGVGQTLFRERAVHVWKAVKKRICTGKSSTDQPPGNLVTIGAFPPLGTLRTQHS